MADKRFVAFIDFKGLVGDTRALLFSAPVLFFFFAIFVIGGVIISVFIFDSGGLPIVSSRNDSCLGIGAEAVECRLSYDQIHVNARINRSNNFNISLNGLRFVFESTSGSAISIDRNEVPDEENVRSYYFTDPRAATIDSVRIAVMLNDTVCAPGKILRCDYVQNYSQLVDLPHTPGGGGGGGGGSSGGGGGGGSPQCSDGIDNDGDTITDYPNDRGCRHADDDNEIELPVAAFSASPVSGFALLDVSFNADSSYDYDGDIVRYEWDFGDNTPLISGAQAVFVTHTFNPGNFNVVLTVYDNEGYSDSENLTLSVFSPTLWVKLNGGMPVDAGVSVADGDPPNFKPITDLQGNVVYFFTDRGRRATYLGRFNSISKAWEIFDSEGWSSSGNALGEIFGGSHRTADRIRMFVDSRDSTRMIGAHSSIGNLAGNYLDAHGNAYAFSFDNQLKYWNSNGAQMSFWNALALTYSFIGSGLFDLDYNRNAGLYVGTFGNNRAEKHFVASRHDLSQEQWAVWNSTQNDWGSPDSFMPSVLPFIARDDRAIAVNVRAVQGTTDFLIVYQKYHSMTYSPLYAALYRDSTKEWFGWNEGWVLNGFANQVIPPFSGKFQSFAVGDSVIIIYNSNRGLEMVRYNGTSQTWSTPTFIDGGPFSSTSDFIASSGPDETLWLVYKTSEAGYSLRTFSGGSWSEAREIYTASSTRSSLSGLAFTNQLPVLFVVDKDINGFDRLFAVSSSDEYWNEQVTRTPPALSTGNVLDAAIGTEATRWDSSFLITLPDGQVIPSAYGTFACGMMDLDSEGYLYCPHTPIGRTSVFPPDYVDNSNPELARAWGNFWDYFSFPGGVAADDTRGKVYISDRMMRDGGGNYIRSGRVQIWEQVNRTRNIVSSSYLPNYLFLPYGQKFNWPVDVALDEPRGILYVSETQGNRIARFDVGGAEPVFVGFIGSEGIQEGQFRLPQGIDTDREGNLYVVDAHNHRVQKFAPDGTFVTSWGARGRNEGSFYYPFALAVDKTKGKVYVSDPYNSRIQVFDLNGAFVYSFSRWGLPPNAQGVSDLNYVTGLAVDNNALFVSAGRLQARIIRFDMNFS